MLSLDDLLALLAQIKQELAYMGVALTVTKDGRPLHIPAPNADVVTCPECQHVFFEAPLCPKCGAMLDAESYSDDADGDGDGDGDRDGDGDGSAPTQDSPREVLLDEPQPDEDYDEKWLQSEEAEEAEAERRYLRSIWP
jgi:hypothetical protein